MIQGSTGFSCAPGGGRLPTEGRSMACDEPVGSRLAAGRAGQPVRPGAPPDGPGFPLPFPPGCVAILGLARPWPFGVTPCLRSS